MFEILDEECLRPGAEDDKRIVIHMDKTFKSNPHYLSLTKGARNLKNQQEFQVTHHSIPTNQNSSFCLNFSQSLLTSH